jgi:transposase
MLKNKVSQYFSSLQRNLFPEFEETIAPQTQKHLQVIVVIDMLDCDRFLPYESAYPVGRPRQDRAALLRAFIAKAVLGLSTTCALIDRLRVDIVLRRICGFNGKLPCAATFSNAFAEFAASNILSSIHEALVSEVFSNRIVGHVSRDSTMIEGREKPQAKPVAEDSDDTLKPKRGRPKKGEGKQPKEPTRLQAQQNMTVAKMLLDLPKSCDVGGKTNSAGNPEWCVGYKLHLDVDDNGIPLTAIVTSASTHDSQVAIPLEAITNHRVKSLYTLMDAAYNSELIEKAVNNAGKIAIIDPKKPRGGIKIDLDPAKKLRYRIRTTVERTNATIKDDFGGRNVRVRGHAKVTAHLMLGIVAMSALRMIDCFT